MKKTEILLAQFRTIIYITSDLIFYGETETLLVQF